MSFNLVSWFKAQLSLSRLTEDLVCVYWLWGVLVCERFPPLAGEDGLDSRLGLEVALGRSL
jgi:hypothetical protein